MTKNINQLQRELRGLQNKLNSLQAEGIGVALNIEEQELIRRVIKSVFSQIKSDADKKTAKSILDKTEWLDG